MVDIANASAILPQARSFIFKILEAGDKYYYPEESDKGTIHLSLEIANDITQDLIGKPIIIGHKKLTEDNIDNQDGIVVGRVVKTFINDKGFETAEGEKIEKDSATYAEGYIDKQVGLDYIKEGYLPSIYYTILEEKKIAKDKVEVLGAIANHLGLVENPKYDTSIHLNDNINQSNYNNIMTKNAKSIANGCYTDKTDMKNSEEPTMDEEVMPLDDILEYLYVADEEGTEYSVAEIWDTIKEDIANGDRVLHLEPEITIEGKTFNVAKLIAMFKEKKKTQAEVETDPVENSSLESTEKNNTNKDVMNSAANPQPSAIKKAFTRLAKVMHPTIDESDDGMLTPTNGVNYVKKQ